MSKWYCQGNPVSYDYRPPCGLVLDVRVIHRSGCEPPWHSDFYCPSCGMEMDKKPAKVRA